MSFYTYLKVIGKPINSRDKFDESVVNGGGGCKIDGELKFFFQFQLTRDAS